MKIAHLMDPLESIQPENETTSHLMYESNERGHTVYFLEPHDVYIRGRQVVARMRNISVAAGLGMEQYWQAVIRCAGPVLREIRSIRISDARQVIDERVKPDIGHIAVVERQWYTPRESRPGP